MDEYLYGETPKGLNVTPEDIANMARDVVSGKCIVIPHTVFKLVGRLMRDGTLDKPTDVAKFIILLTEKFDGPDKFIDTLLTIADTATEEEIEELISTSLRQWKTKERSVDNSS